MCAIKVIIGKVINVLSINIINKSLIFNGISDFKIIVPVSVIYINWVNDKAPIINLVISNLTFEINTDGKNISAKPTSTAGAASIAPGIFNINTIG